MKISVVLTGNLEDDCSQLQQKIDALNLNKPLIVVDNETIELVDKLKNYKIINVDKDIIIHFSDFLLSMEQIRDNSMNFFLFEILNSIFLLNNEYSVITKLQEIIKDEKDVIFLNPYIYNPDYYYINIIGTKIHLNQHNNGKLLLNSREFSKDFFIHNPEMHKIILGIKILTSSFFLSEFFDFYYLLTDIPEEFEYIFPDNYFFTNLLECIQFFESSEIKLEKIEALKMYDSIKEAYEYLKDILKFKEPVINIRSILYKTGFFYKNIEIYNQDIINELNVNHYYLYKPNLKNKLPVERVITIETDEKYEHYSSPYLYYMKAVLGFTVKSVKEKWLKSIYQSITNTIQYEKPFELPFAVEKIYGDGTKIFLFEVLKRMYFCGKDLYYDDLPIFIITSSYVESRAKTFCRKNNMQNCYKLDLITKEISKLSVRATKSKKKFVKVKY